MSRSMAMSLLAVSGVGAGGAGLASWIASERVATLRALGDSVDRAVFFEAVRVSNLWLVIFLTAAALTIISYSHYVSVKKRERKVTL